MNLFSTTFSLLLLCAVRVVVTVAGASNDNNEDREKNTGPQDDTTTTCGTLSDGQQHDLLLHSHVSRELQDCTGDHFYRKDVRRPPIPDCPPFDPHCELCVNRSEFVSINSPDSKPNSHDWCDKTIRGSVELDGFLLCPSTDGPMVDGGTLDCKMNAISAEFGAVILTNGGTLKNCLIEALDSSNSTIYMMGNGNNVINNVLSK